MHHLYRVLFAVIFVVVSFVPPFGLIWLAIEQATTHPYLTAFLGSLWVIVAALLLPLNQNTFKQVLFGANATMIGVLTLYLFMSGTANGWADWLWWTYGAVAVGLIIGLQIIASSIWRWVRGIMPVDTGHQHDDV